LDFPELAERVAETLDIGPGTRVFEVDCGDGAFLFPFHQNGYIVGGIDGDAAMIAQAIAAMPDGLFTVSMASALDPAAPWDVVVCRSLSGLSAVASAKVEAPDKDYIRGLVARMFAKATHAIALLGVPERQHQPLMHALAQAGAKAIQIDGDDLFARV
jgi:trans-aconitate methyltransferase